MNARRFLNAANNADGIEALAAEKCGRPVQELLIRIASSFPSAHIVATGYYPVISENTPHDLFMRVLAKRFYAPVASEGPKLSDDELLKRLASVSNAWYEASNKSLMEAVEKTNAALALKGSRQRALFAKIPFSAEQAFAAKESRLWGFDGTTLRKLLAVVTLGTVNLRSNDEVRSQRASMCEEVFKRLPRETEQQKQTRKNELIVCRGSVGPSRLSAPRCNRADRNAPRDRADGRRARASSDAQPVGRSRRASSAVRGFPVV